MAVETSVIIDFGESESSEVTTDVVVELDPEYEGNLNSDGELRSSFGIGDPAVFLLNWDSSVVNILDVTSTDGSIGRLYKGALKQSRSVEGLFVDEDTEVSTGYSNTSNPVYTWYGNEGRPEMASGIIKVTDGGRYKFPCSCLATFDVEFQEQWQLTIPSDLELEDDETYTIYIVVYAEIIA